jgi:hypothetical protein
MFNAAGVGALSAVPPQPPHPAAAGVGAEAAGVGAEYAPGVGAFIAAGVGAEMCAPGVGASNDV